MKLMGIDIGTTHCKVGIFQKDGEVVKIASYPTQVYETSEGYFYYDPEMMWSTIVEGIEQVMKMERDSIVSIGITSMAEAGLLVDKITGKPRTHIIPWFDKRTVEEFKIIDDQIDAFERFCITGLHNSYKYGLYKLKWFQEQDPGLLVGAVWLSVADYIVYRLTGKMTTDYTLAARTYLFNIYSKKWDVKFIRQIGFNIDLFPDVYPSGNAIGKVNAKELQSCFELSNAYVAVAGHDHVCAALAVGAIDSGVIFDSMGTAETLMEAMPVRKLTKEDYESGFSFGCHVLKNRLFWLGSISSSGASVEWFRSNLLEKNENYEEIQRLLGQVKDEPTNIVYFPYLSGSNAPMPDADMKAGFIGLQASHEKKDIVKAMLEGTGYEMEWIRKTAEKLANTQIREIIAVGGGTRNHFWLQIKSDISGCIFRVLPITEASLLGAAWISAINSNIGLTEMEIKLYYSARSSKNFRPQAPNHSKYQQIYQYVYMALQRPLRETSKYLIGRDHL